MNLFKRKFVIMKEWDTKRGNWYFCAYRVFLWLFYGYVYGSLELTLEDCENRLRYLVEMQDKKPRVVKTIYL